MPEPVDTTGWVRIEVRDPLPMHIAGALIQLIGSAWPDARIDTRAHAASVAMLVNPATRTKKVGKRAARAVVADAEEACEGIEGAQFGGIEDGWVKYATPEELQLHLGEVAHSIWTAWEQDNSTEIPNYLEWSCHTEGHAQQYAVALARTKGQTPGELRKRAERALDDARADLARVHTELEAARAEIARLRAQQHVHAGTEETA